MTEPVRLARQTRVADCQDLLEIGPLLVHREDDLLDIVRRSAAQPATRTIGVVDEEGRIVGIIPVPRLTEAIIARVAPEAVMAGIKDVAEAARFGHAVEDRIAGDIMEPPVTLAPERTISEAFRELHREHATGMYVVDSDGRPTGYVDLLELAIRLTDALEAERKVRDGDETRPAVADASHDASGTPGAAADGAGAEGR